jgi:hypothetical protein
VLDGAVLAGRVHALQDKQHRPAILRVKPFLKVPQAFAVGIEDLLGLVLVEIVLLIGLLRLEMKRTRSVEAERLDKRLELCSYVGEFQRLVHIEGIGRSGAAPDQFAVIARSASDEAIQFYARIVDCFASLAMTGLGPSR